MNNRVVTSLLALGGVILAAVPMMLSRRARPRGWQRLSPWFTQMMNALTGRGGPWRRMLRNRVRA